MKHPLCILIVLLIATHLLPAFEPLDWSGATQVTPGIDILKFEEKTPRVMKIGVARIDLKSGRFYFKATSRAPEDEWGKPMKGFPELLVRTIRITTRQFMTEARKAGEDMVLAITKKSSNRKTKSVMDDMENVASTLFRFFNAIK